jgi:hypothetical protein
MERKPKILDSTQQDEEVKLIIERSHQISRASTAKAKCTAQKPEVDKSDSTPLTAMTPDAVRS